MNVYVQKCYFYFTSFRFYFENKKHKLCKEKEQHKNNKNNYIYLVLQNFVTRIHIIIQSFVGNK